MQWRLPDLDGLAYGGDYNPDQWPREVWDEDVRLMREAGVNLVSVAIFSWARIQPRPGTWDVAWLDEVLDLLHSNGIYVDLATATASPPPWLARLHPETLPVNREGVRLSPGGRQAYCPSSPVFREHSLAVAEFLAQRYAQHPAVVMWHVSNELGCHNVHCYCDVSAQAFRDWLRARYETVERLNQVWGTSFWSQRYDSWEEVNPPRLAPTFVNPTQQLDYFRFSSDEQRAQLRLEREVIRRHSDKPVTTNFMVGTGIKYMDYATWTDDVDLVSNDHYLTAADPDGHIGLALSADTTRGVAHGDPWFLMEHSTSAVNWQPRNVAKQPGQLRRNSLAHVAHGADAVLFFQWRASAAGAEKFHSALVPHAGADTKVFREVCQLGRDLRALRPVLESRVESDVAILHDWEAWWACELDSHPSTDVTYPDMLRRAYESLWRHQVGVDVVHPSSDLTVYRLVVIPTLYLVSETHARAVADYVRAGGHVLVTYFSGIVDEEDHIRLGGYPGAFRELLGVRTEEFFPLREGERVGLDDGSSADVWTEWLHLEGAQPVASYEDGPLPGVPAITRHDLGEGTAWYLATRLDQPDLHRLMHRILEAAQVSPLAEADESLELVRRRAADGTSYLFALNHGSDAASVKTTGTDLLTGQDVDGSFDVAAGDVAVIAEPAVERDGDAVDDLTARTASTGSGAVREGAGA